MDPSAAHAQRVDTYRELVARLLADPRATDGELAAAAALVRAEPGSELALHALCMVLEGALADPKLAIDDTQVLVPLLKDLAHGRVRPDELV